MKNNLPEAEKYLTQFPVMKDVISSYSLEDFVKQKSVFHELVAGIVFQQISFKAATSIYNRFLIKMGGDFYSVDDLLEITEEEMQECGLSNQKRKYMKNIATFFKEHKLDYVDWTGFSNEDIFDRLIQIKGVGEWTIQMLLMFYLERPDIFPTKDLGIQIAMRGLFDLTEEKKELEQKMKEIAEPWRPYRTVASMYLWAWKRDN